MTIKENLNIKKIHGKIKQRQYYLTNILSTLIVEQWMVTSYSNYFVFDCRLVTISN